MTPVHTTATTVMIRATVKETCYHLFEGRPNDPYGSAFKNIDVAHFKARRLYANARIKQTSSRQIHSAQRTICGSRCASPKR